jgi:hypothetical protein
VTPAETRFKEVVAELAASGVYPSPNAIRKALGRPSRSDRNGGDVLNGRETRWRRQVLYERGWTEKPLRIGVRRPRFAWTPPGLA